MCILPEIMKIYLISWTAFICLPLVYDGCNNRRTLNLNLCLKDSIVKIFSLSAIF